MAEKIDPELIAKLKRIKPSDKKEADVAKGAVATVAAGPFGNLLDGAHNPAPERLPEYSRITERQAQILPLLDVVEQVLNYCIQVAEFRESEEDYQRKYSRGEPELIEPTRLYIHKMLQYQKSIRGANLDAITDLIKTDMETRAKEDLGLDAEQGNKLWG